MTFTSVYLKIIRYTWLGGLVNSNNNNNNNNKCRGSVARLWRHLCRKITITRSFGKLTKKDDQCTRL
ncbi:MAG: hypothetical protein N7Q72_06270, partial [Spiroplasma sp. Tabriz.8]|nr:hypothetical protein [Spiroplasma sp. Tabriz.8]